MLTPTALAIALAGLPVGRRSTVAGILGRPLVWCGVRAGAGFDPHSVLVVASGVLDQYTDCSAAP